MKKLFLAMVAAICTIITVNANSGDTTCRVYGAEDIVATIEKPVVNNNGVTLKVAVKLSKPAPEGGIQVAIEVADSKKQIVATDIVEIEKGRTGGAAFITDMDKGVFYISIANASCK